MSMNFGQPQMPPEENKQEVDLVYEPKVLPIENKGEYFPYGDDFYYPKKQDVVEKWDFRNRMSDMVKVRYSFSTIIAGLEYVFESGLTEGGNRAGFVFKTKEYDYSRTNLDEEGTKALFETIINFLESIYVDTKGEVVIVHFSPIEVSYTVREVEDCIEEILRHSNEYSREELMAKKQGIQIFEYYHELFNKDFSNTHFKNKAPARSRYFIMQFKKYLKEWNIQKDPFGGVGFDLVRKGVEITEEK